MARNYKELRAKMSPEARRRSEEKTMKKKATQPKHAFEMPDGDELSIPGASPARHGFTKRGDHLKPSPGRLDEQNEWSNEQAGVDALVETVMRFAAAANSRIAARRRQWWKDIALDFGLDDDQPELVKRLRLQGEWLSLAPEVEPEPQPKNNQG